MAAVKRQRRGSQRRYLNPGQNFLHRRYHRRIGRFDADSGRRCGERDCAHHAIGPRGWYPFDRRDANADVVTANTPCQIAFQVASKIDNQVILDENGADRLLGQGENR
jgi:hypothetical protein